jgi:hypothetical protein
MLLKLENWLSYKCGRHCWWDPQGHLGGDLGYRKSATDSFLDYWVGSTIETCCAMKAVNN